MAPSRGHAYAYVSRANLVMSKSVAAMIPPWLSTWLRAVRMLRR